MSSLLLAVLIMVLGSGRAWADYAAQVTATPEKTVDSGELVTHVFTILNTGSDADIYELMLILPDGWTALPIPATIPVSPGGQGIVFVNFLVPVIASAGQYDVILRAQSSFDPGLVVEASGSVCVRSTSGLAIEWIHPLPAAQPGGTAEASFRVTNTGNSDDFLRVRVSADESLSVDLSEIEFALAPMEYRDVFLRLGVPATALGQETFVVVVTVMSVMNTALHESLRDTLVLGPPPPELVGGHLFPEWVVSGSFSIDCGGEPTLAFRGWGDIEGIGTIQASIGLSMDEGLENARARIETEDWTLNLSGGGIGSSFLSVSGKPMWSGDVEDWFTWYLLYTATARGLYGRYQHENGACRVSLGHDFDRSLSFQEVELEYDFPGPPSAWFTLESGTQTESGTAMAIGGELEFGDCAWQLEGSYVTISPGFPLHAPTDEIEIRASFDECPLPFGFSATWVEKEAGTPPNEYLLHGQNYAGSIRLPMASPWSGSASFSVGHQESDDLPQTIDTLTRSVAGSIEGGELVTWSLSGGFQTLEDRIAATTVTSLQIAAGFGFPLGPVRLDPSVSLSAMTDHLGTTYASGLSLQVGAEEWFLSPTATLSVGGENGSIGGGLSWNGPNGDEFVWTAEVGLCGEPTFSTQLRLTLKQAFPFCGPTKGRITGTVFVDANGNGEKDAGEDGVPGVLLEAGEMQAISGDRGWFVFPPMQPGDYALDLVDLPSGLTAGVPVPLKISLWQGMEEAIWIPLQPRSWLLGRVFLDRNRNTVRDGGDQGLSGVSVRILGQGVDRVVTTDSGGRFAVEARPGPLSAVGEAASLPERCELTTPANAVLSMPLYGAVDVQFGVYQRPRPVVVTFGPPSAMFSALPALPSAGEIVRLTDESSASARATLVDWQWRFELGETVLQASGASVELALPAPGAWRVRLIVTDSDGLKGAVEKVIHVR